MIGLFPYFVELIPVLLFNFYKLTDRRLCMEGKFDPTVSYAGFLWRV